MNNVKRYNYESVMTEPNWCEPSPIQDKAWFIAWKCNERGHFKLADKIIDAYGLYWPYEMAILFFIHMDRENIKEVK